MHDIKWHSLDTPEVLGKLGTDTHRGLTGEEAQKRLAHYGPNELKKEERVSPLSVFLHQFTNILIIILLIATGLSALVGEIVDAALILVIVFFCAISRFCPRIQS